MNDNIYDDAYYLQSASNTRAVVARFAAMMPDILAELVAEKGYADDPSIRSHPVFVFMCSKLNDLAGHDQRFAEAYKQVVKKMSPEARKIHGILDEEAA